MVRVHLIPPSEFGRDLSLLKWPDHSLFATNAHGLAAAVAVLTVSNLVIANALAPTAAPDCRTTSTESIPLLAKACGISPALVTNLSKGKSTQNGWPAVVGKRLMPAEYPGPPTAR